MVTGENGAARGIVPEVPSAPVLQGLPARGRNTSNPYYATDQGFSGERGLGSWTGAERKAGPKQEGGNKPGPGYTLLRGGTRKVSP